MSDFKSYAILEMNRWVSELQLPDITNTFNPLFCATGISAILLLIYLVSTFNIKQKLCRTSASYTQTEKQIVKQQSRRGIRKPSPETCSKDWWRDPKLFELERRGIFSKEWFFVTHSSRFNKTGDYRTFEIAGFSFIVILGKDRKLRAFHNVCRHRAYAVTKKEIGSSAVLGCRYHGWSYDTRGKLIKAPEFDTVEGFEKEANSLWEIKIQVQHSMVFVNFDNGVDVAALELKDAEKLVRRWGISRMSPVLDWKIEGHFNWKLADLLQDCTQILPSPWYKDLPNWIWDNRRETRIARLTLVRRVKPGAIFFAKIVPKSSAVTVLECSVFAMNSSAIGSKAEEMQKSFALEIEELASRQRGILSNKEILPLRAMPYQAGIGEILKEHAEIERKVGMEIHPAARSQSLTLAGKADDDFCRELEEGRSSICSVNSKGLLDW